MSKGLLTGNGMKFTVTAIKVLKELLHNARQNTTRLAEKLNIAQTTVSWVIREKLARLGGNYIYFLNPEKLGMRITIARVRSEPASTESVADALVLLPVVRQLFIDDTSDEIYAVVVAPEWKLRDLKQRLRGMQSVREYQLLPVHTMKFEQPVPPEVLDEIVRASDCEK